MSNPHRIDCDPRRKWPGFGKVVAIDSTDIRVWSNGNKPRASDPDAGWCVKSGTHGKKKYTWGYKVRILADAEYELPIEVDSPPVLPTLGDLTSPTGDAGGSLGLSRSTNKGSPPCRGPGRWEPIHVQVPLILGDRADDGCNVAVWGTRSAPFEQASRFAFRAPVRLR